MGLRSARAKTVYFSQKGLLFDETYLYTSRWTTRLLQSHQQGMQRGGARFFRLHIVANIGSL